jgi:hypothetical protein
VGEDVEGVAIGSAEYQIDGTLGNINSPQKLSVWSVDKDLFCRDIDIAILVLRYRLSSLFAKSVTAPNVPSGRTSTL